MQFAYNSISYSSLSFSFFLCAHQFAHSSSRAFFSPKFHWSSFCSCVCRTRCRLFLMLFSFCFPFMHFTRSVVCRSIFRWLLVFFFFICFRCSLVLRFSHLAVVPFWWLATYSSFIAFACICIVYIVRGKATPHQNDDEKNIVCDENEAITLYFYTERHWVGLLGLRCTQYAD